MKDPIAIIKDNIDPNTVRHGLVSHDYVDEYFGRPIEFTRELPQLHLVVVAPNTTMNDLNLPHVSYIRHNDTPKYLYTGDETLPNLDFCILDGIKPQVATRIWSQLKIGGIAISSGKHRSLKFAPKLSGDHWLVKKTRWIMVSGCHRGGTMFTHRVLYKAGIKMQHQDYGKDGIVSGSLAACEHLDGSRVIHQIRDPLKSIESLQGVITRIVAEFKSCPLRGISDPPLRLAMKYYHWIHTLAKMRNLWTYRVEDMEERWPDICERLEIDRPMPKVSTKTNARTYHVNGINWSDLYRADEKLAHHLNLLAEGWGYK